LAQPAVNFYYSYNHTRTVLDCDRSNVLLALCPTTWAPYTWSRLDDPLQRYHDLKFFMMATD